MLRFVLLISLTLFVTSCNTVDNGSKPESVTTPTVTTPTKELSLSQLEQDTFAYFWDTTSAENGLAPDRFPSESPASIAATGFALTAYGVGVERGYIERTQAVDRTLLTLRYLSELPSGTSSDEAAGYQGFYYHFLDMDTGLRHQGWEVELSTVDTALLMAGVLFAQSYYDQDSAAELEIRTLADNLFKRVNWQWAQNNSPLISHGWFPGKGFIDNDWDGYNEAMLVYILALGSPTYPVSGDAWTAWTDHYEDDWGGSGDLKHLTFAPLFGHQYSHIWVDFRDIQDDYMAEKGSDYFINSTKAVYSQRQYAIANVNQWADYGENVWGITASDGPGNFRLRYKGATREFRAYSARGVAVNYSFDDGTLAPTALGGSLPFAPEIVGPAIANIYDKYGERIYGEYGFRDSFNPSFNYDVTSETGQIVQGSGWVSKDYVGIDQGPILTMLENYRSDLIWRTMRKNPYIQTGLKRAGFTGGWLAETNPE